MSADIRLINALRELIRNRTPETIKSAIDLITEIAPSPESCPTCAYPGAIKRGTVKIHFAKVSDARPCPASFRNTAGGILL